VGTKKRLENTNLTQLVKELNDVTQKIFGCTTIENQAFIDQLDNKKHNVEDNVRTELEQKILERKHISNNLHYNDMNEKHIETDFYKLNKKRKLPFGDFELRNMLRLLAYEYEEEEVFIHTLESNLLMKNIKEPTPIQHQISKQKVLTVKKMTKNLVISVLDKGEGDRMSMRPLRKTK
jgi:hypothetical protein